MSPRRRIEGRSEWPEGLYKKKIRGVERFLFRNENGKETLFPSNTSFIDAYQAAQTYNEQYRNPTAVMAAKLDKFNKPIRDWSVTIKKRVSSEEELGENAASTFEKDVNRLDALFGNILSKDITAAHATEYLNHYCVIPGKSTNVYNRKLSFLNKYFDYLLDEQGIETHPSRVKKWRKVKRADKKKLQADLDINGYYAIYDAAPTWLKVAMALCLQSTHAVKELHRLKHKIQKPKEGQCGCMWFNEPTQEYCPTSKKNVTVYGKMFIHRHKSQHKKTSFVAIPITDEIKKAIDLSKTDGLICPYVVRRKPKRNNKISQHCDHRFQVTSNHISREFSKVRDSIGVYDHLPKEKRPTFHEIRRLAAQTLMGDGVNPMERMAHSNESSTKIYTDKNDIEWVEVSPVAITL